MDTKLQTFLALCRLMNYRMTAEELHLTQPAITKQIQTLEQIYHTKLFVYDGRRLYKTQSCGILESYCESLQYNDEIIRKELMSSTLAPLRIGATKTIGDYVIGPYVISYLSEKNRGLSLVTDNTGRLLKLLDDAKLDFAVIEGFFDKKKYEHRLFRNEPFIGMCPKGHRFAGKTVAVEEVLNETLIARELGSGTRDILEHELRGLGYDLSAFSRVVFISSFKLIRELVQNNIGISFVYQSVLDRDKSFSTFRIKKFNHEHEFNIVYLKNTVADRAVEAFLSAANRKSFKD